MTAFLQILHANVLIPAKVALSESLEREGEREREREKTTFKHFILFYINQEENLKDKMSNHELEEEIKTQALTSKSPLKLGSFTNMHVYFKTVTNSSSQKDSNTELNFF